MTSCHLAPDPISLLIPSCLPVVTVGTSVEQLTSCWIWLFNLCFPLLWFTKSILSLCNGLPQGTLPLCLNIKPQYLCSGPCPVHLWRVGRKKWQSSLRLAILGYVCKINGLFTLFPYHPHPRTLCSVMSDCDPIDCNSPGFSVHEISQAGILERAALSYSRGSSGSMESLVSPASTGGFFTTCVTWEVPPPPISVL